VTEGERLTLTRSSCARRLSPPATCDKQSAHRIRPETLACCRFHSNKGNLAGAVMITAGAVAVVKNNTFLRVGHHAERTAAWPRLLSALHDP